MTIRFTLFGLFAVPLCLAQEGSQVFISRCLQCHSSASTSHASTQEALAQIPWQDILKALESGVMKVQAQNLSQDDRVAVSRYVGKEAGTQVLPQVTGFCDAGTKPTGSTDGMLYVNSGYGGQGMAGNVLLAFSAR